MRSWIAAAILLCLSPATGRAAEAVDPWVTMSPVARAPANLRDSPLAEDRIVAILPGARDEAFGLLSKRAVVRLDAETYRRLSGRESGWDRGLRPYLVRASERDDGVGALQVFAASGHVLVEYNGPLVPANCRHAALILLLPFAPKLHLSGVLYD